MSQPDEMMLSVTPADTAVAVLSACRIDSPLAAKRGQVQSVQFVEDHDRVLLHDTAEVLTQLKLPLEKLATFELAGPRTKSSSTPPRRAWAS